jgi:hypothetical protein
MQADRRGGFHAAFPTVIALVGLVQRILGSDSLRPIGALATLLSIIVSVGEGVLLGGPYGLRIPGGPLILEPIIPAVGIVGFVMALGGLRVLGGILMALAAVAQILMFLALISFMQIFSAPFVALEAALWMAAALAAWSPQQRIYGSA